MSHNIKRIPYGLGDYTRMRRDNSYYVDKTQFIPLLEAAPYFVFFIRPRRFGKTLWVTTLETYYDVNTADQFAELFGGTWIGEHPTAERNSYLILSLNFSVVNPNIQYVEQSFEANGETVLRHFLHEYARFFSEQEQQTILGFPRFADKLRELFFTADVHNLKVYLLIDEYDNFANTILTTVGKQAYHDLTHGGGFFRYFFNLFKGATTGKMGGLTRLFITGVSPITMDDVSSGFNIGKSISLDPRFNELMGFTVDDVRTMLAYYQNVGEFALDIDACLEVMMAWYNHYRFSKHAARSVFNSDMALYFVLSSLGQTTIPDDLIDQNVRIDYGKLRHLVLVDRQLNGNFSQLKQILESGETTGEVATSFPLERLLDRENFVSLLFFLGLLSFDGVREGRPVLRIPNLTVKKLMYEYLREAYRDVDIFRIDLWNFATLVAGMAYRGDWQPVFDLLAAEIAKQTAVRDYLAGEKVIQGFLLAYLNITNFFLTWTERELNKGYADLYLEPFLARYPDMRYGYLIELKYIARSEFSETALQAAIADAETQLRKYATDAQMQRMFRDVTVKLLILVYNGWELVYRAERPLNP